MRNAMIAVCDIQHFMFPWRLSRVACYFAERSYWSLCRPNPKHMGTTYLKSESQTLWARNASRKNKALAEESQTDAPQVTEQR